MRLKLCNKSWDAFTRVELLIVLTSAALLSILGLSVLGSSGPRNDLIVCANNLRQVGRAFHMWASDHGGENPWWTSYADGGNYIRLGGSPPPGGILNVPGYGPAPAALRINAWMQFAFINQELSTPAVLVCPTDSTKVRATEFSSNPEQGYFASSFQNGATSYFIGIHAVSLFPSSMLSGDRSIKEDGVSSTCPVGIGALPWIRLNGAPRTWNTDLHPGGGNLLANDGHVEDLSPEGLTRFMGRPGVQSGTSHFLKPN